MWKSQVHGNVHHGKTLKDNNIYENKQANYNDIQESEIRILQRHEMSSVKG